MKLLFDQNLSPKLVNHLADQVEAVIRARFADIESFEKDPSLGTLVLS